jgi:hypothetical protein
VSSRTLAALACALLAASACTPPHPENDHSASGEIGSGIPISPSTPVGEPGKDVFLTQQPGQGRPFRLGATAVYDACTVLPWSAVREVGIEMDTGYQVFHTFVERDAPGDPSKAQAGVKGLSACGWSGVDLKQVVVLDIYQSPFTDDRDRTNRLEGLKRKGAKEAAVRGMSTFTTNGGVTHDPQEWQVSIFADGYFAVLSLNTSQPSVVTALVDGIVANLQRGPTGPATFAYTGPYAGVPDPCTLFTRDDFRRNYGIDDEGRVFRALTPGDLPQDDDSHQLVARYIRITCTRKGIGETFDDGRAPGLEVEFNVTPDADQAAHLEFLMCDPNSSAHVFGPPLVISTKIGDGRVCMPNINRASRPLVFRAGRTMVHLYNWLSADAANLNALATKLTPIAQAIAARLR